jgi:Fic family protein
LGRLLMPLFLSFRRATRHPVLMLSPYFERNRREYYHSLQAVSHYGEWEKWLLFFLDAVVRQSREALETVQHIAALREETRNRLIAARATDTIFRLLDTLLENPYVTTSYVTQKLGVTVPTARGALAVLENLGFIEEITGRKRGQRFCATAVVDAVVRHD